MATFSGGEEITGILSLFGGFGSYTVPAGKYALFTVNGGKCTNNSTLGANSAQIWAPTGSSASSMNAARPEGFAYNELGLKAGEVFSWSNWTNFSVFIREFNTP